MVIPQSRSFTAGTQGIGGRKLAMDMLPEDRMAFRLMLESSQGRGMKGAREWLKNRFGSPPDLIQTMNESKEEKQKTLSHTNLITPQSVPKFVIPLSSRTPLKHSISHGGIQQEDKEFSGTTNYHKCSLFTASERSSLESMIGQRMPSACKDSESCSTSGTCSLHSDDFSSDSGTNDDLKSAAAVSLPHLRASTPYGFTTLTESPHTRRRESLLFSSASLRRVRRLLSSREKISHREDTGPESSETPPQYSLAVASAMSLTISTNSLQSESSLSLLSSPLVHYSSPNQMSKKKYSRRRSSFLSQPELASLKSLSSSKVSSENRNEQVQRCAPLGEVKLSLLYNQNDSKLHLSIIKAENLAKKITEKNNLKIFIKVCILPGKSHSQVSEVCKGTHHPTFNQQFTFADIKNCSMQGQHLRLRFYNQRSSKKYETLGDVILPLDTLGLDKGEELKIWRKVETMSKYQQLGALKVSAKFEPRKDNLDVTLVEATGLPKHSFTGPPDCYVRVIVQQDDNPAIKKHTRTLKNTSNPVFNETLSFTVSPKVESLRYTTVTIQVFSKERLRSDTTLGNVVLGYSSSTEDELIHWSRLLNNPSAQVEHLHQLQPATRQAVKLSEVI